MPSYMRLAYDALAAAGVAGSQGSLERRVVEGIAALGTFNGASVGPLSGQGRYLKQLYDAMNPRPSRHTGAFRQIVSGGGGDEFLADVLAAIAASATPPAVAPTITGTAAEGVQLSTDAANPQWQRGAGSLFYDITGETGATYTPDWADVGIALRVRDTVTGLASAATAAVAETPLFFDTFTEPGTGNASIAGHQADIGGTWSQHPSGVSGVSIDRDNDRAIGTVSSGANYFVNSQQIGVDRIRVTTQMKTSGGAICSFLMGFSNSGALDGYRFYRDGGNWTWQRYHAGALTQVFTSNNFNPGTSEFTFHLTLEALADRARLRYNSPAHTEPSQTDDTDANRKTSLNRYMGLGPRTNAYFDSFKVLAMDDAPLVAADAIWTWYTDPRAIRHSSVDYVAYLDKAGAVKLAKRAAGVDTTVSVGTANSPVDDHNNAALCVLPGGRLWVGYADHNDAVGTRYKVSTNALPDISAFSAERSIGLNGSVNVSYVNPIILSDGVMRVIRRSGSGGTIHDMCTATATNVEAGTETWAFTTLINVAHAYAKLAVSPDNHKLFILFGTGHPNTNDTALYAACLDVSSGSPVWKKLDGTVISLPLTASNATLVRGSGSGQPNNWTWDAVVGADGHPRFLATRYPSGQGSPEPMTNIEYWHYRWDGSAIIQTQLLSGQKSLYATEAFYAGGMCFDGNDPTILYLSALDADGYYQVGEYRLDEATSTLTKVRNVSSRAIAHNCRPFSPKGHGTETAVYWWRGKYTTYLSFDTQLHRSA